MKALEQFHQIILLCIAGVLALPVSAAEPDERDRQVLETLLLNLLSDPNFDMTRVPVKGATIVLHTRTPEKTGFLMPHQIRAEIGSRKLPGDAGSDMRRRNTPTGEKPDTYDSVTATYTNLAFAHGIVVTNLAEVWSGSRYSLPSKVRFPRLAAGWRHICRGFPRTANVP
jgi:hypothetical protein